MTRPLIKICGVTTKEDALAAVQAGADLIGLIFVPASPREVTLPQAQDIAAAIRHTDSGVRVVGVFQNQPVALLEQYTQALHLDLIQLHGDEPATLCRQLSRPVIKVLTVDADQPGLAGEAFHDYLPLSENNIQYLLLDAPKGQSSQRLPETDAVRQLFRSAPVFLAGGLTPENVPERIHLFSPVGVDVASGVEAQPGLKDPEKIKAFCEAVRAANQASNGVQTV